MNVEDLENLVLTTGPDDIPALPELPPEIGMPDAATAAPVDIVSFAEFREMWIMAHMFAGGTLSMRIGAPVDLATIAQDDTGSAAAQAAYDLASKSAFLRSTLLNRDRGAMTQWATVAMHLWAIIQAIGAAKRAAQIERQQAA